MFRLQAKRELKTLRRVCKSFDAAAVPLLFDRIFLIARYAELEVASLVAARFGPFIKTLMLPSERYEFNEYDRYKC